MAYPFAVPASWLISGFPGDIIRQPPVHYRGAPCRRHVPALASGGSASRSPKPCQARMLRTQSSTAPPCRSTAAARSPVGDQCRALCGDQRAAAADVLDERANTVLRRVDRLGIGSRGEPAFTTAPRLLAGLCLGGAGSARVRAECSPRQIQKCVGRR
jgi:hypothetical protein